MIHNYGHDQVIARPWETILCIHTDLYHPPSPRSLHAQLSIDIASAVAYLHDHNIIHR